MEQVPKIKVTRYVFSTFISNLVVGGSGFILSIIIARALGPEGKGYITAIILWPTVLASICSFGYAHANIYQAANHRIDASKLVTNSFLMFFIIAPFAVLIGWLGLPLFFKSTNAALLQASRISLIAIPILLLQSFMYGLLRGWQKMDHFNFLKILDKVVLLLMLFALILFQNIALKEITIAWILISLSITTISVIFVFRNQTIKLSGDKRLFIDTVKYGLKSYLGSISEWGNLRLDQLIMAALFTAASLGIYSVAVTVTESLLLVAFAFSMVVFPVTSALSEKDAANLTAKASRITLFVLLGVAIIIFLIAPKLVVLLFGPKFVDVILLTKILLPGVIAFGVGRVVVSGLMGINQPLKASITQISALVATIMFAPPLIIFYGAIGAAIASNVAYGVYLLAGLVYFNKYNQLSYKDVLIVRKSDFDLVKKIFRAPRTKTS